MLASLHGDVDQIIDIKAPIEIGKILSSQLGKTLQCVLVEGAPGVGKSTLAWEVSKQWGKGVSNQQFAIVILLRLRDQAVQNARNISDLIFYQHSQKEISQYLDSIEGRNILVILEGLDELPTHRLTQSSVFTRLLSGKLLPHATILVTSRPSATAQLWNNWKHRVSRHIEILGFTQENITQYTASVLPQQELSAFQNYLSINPHIKTIMYIPLHAAIVIEVYKMCQDYSRTLPTTITELYTCFVQTVLLRYITSQPDYKGEQVDLDKFTDLSPLVYDNFYNLTQLAYNGVIHQQLIFKPQHSIQHLGFMKAVTELFPNKLTVTYSYNFLHLSIQEYLAAYYISTMETAQQEQLLRRMCTETHLQNMGLFLAGITKFAGMDKAVVSKTIEQECKSTVGLNWYEPIEEEAIQLSTHALQLLYESGDASILDSNRIYGCPLTNHSPLFDFSTLGYCITHSNCKWELHLGTNAQLMKSPEGIEILVQALKISHSNSSSICCIKRFILNFGTPECVEQLLAMPVGILQQLQTLGLVGSYYNRQPLPQWVPELLIIMSSLRSLVLNYITGATAVRKTVQAVVSTNTLKELQLTCCDIDYGCVTILYRWLLTSSKLEALDISLPSTKAIEMISTALTTNSNIKILHLGKSKFSLPAMQAMCSMLTHNNTITELKLPGCHIDDDIICCLAKNLHSNNTITTLDFRRNSISDRGAVCVAEMLKINNSLQKVDLSVNPIGLRGQLVLKAFDETSNKVIVLDYKELNYLKETCSKCKQM